MDIEAFLAEIEAKTDAIWMEEPTDLVRLRSGIVDSGAGSYDHVFMTLLFVQSETRGVAMNACQAILTCAADEAFNLHQLKVAARAHMTGRSGLLDYMGLHELGGLFRIFLTALDDFRSKEDFVRGLQALKTYGVRMHMWTLWSFPWHVGMSLRRISAADAEVLHVDAANARWKNTSYMGR